MSLKEKPCHLTSRPRTTILGGCPPAETLPEDLVALWGPLALPCCDTVLARSTPLGHITQPTILPSKPPPPPPLSYYTQHSHYLQSHLHSFARYTKTSPPEFFSTTFRKLPGSGLKPEWTSWLAGSHPFACWMLKSIQLPYSVRHGVTQQECPMEKPIPRIKQMGKQLIIMFKLAGTLPEFTPIENLFTIACTTSRFQEITLKYWTTTVLTTNFVKLLLPQFISNHWFAVSLTPWLMEPAGSMPHSQGLSNNSYPEPNQPNSSH